LKIGLLPVQLAAEQVRSLLDLAQEQPGVEATVDLEAQRVTMGDLSYRFQIDAHSRHSLLEGLDEIGLTLALEPEIAAYEKDRAPWLPTISG